MFIVTAIIGAYSAEHLFSKKDTEYYYISTHGIIMQHFNNPILVSVFK